MIVELKKKSLFLSLISIFKNKSKIGLSFSKDNILIDSIEIQKYFLSVPNTLYENDSTCDKLTINPGHLYNALTLIPTNTFEIHSDILNVCLDSQFIKIPLISTIIHTYEEVDDVHTKFVVDSKTIAIISNLKGLVKYEIENGKLFIRKVGKEVVEEIELKNLNFIETGELSFSCNNIWSEVVTPILNIVDKILFLFGSNVLSVQFLFRKEEKIFLEVQIPKMEF